MRVGRVEMTGGFFLLVAWLNYFDRQNLVLLTALACFAHELGHYGALRCLRQDLRLLRLTAVGAEMYMKRPLSYRQECFVAAAGPLVNLVLARIACRHPGGELFAGLNVSLACFNLLPIGQLDGSRIFHGVLYLLCPPVLAEEITRRVGECCCVLLLGLGGILVWRNANYTLLLVGGWLCVRTFSLPVSKNRAERIEKGVVRRQGNR